MAAQRTSYAQPLSVAEHTSLVSSNPLPDFFFSNVVAFVFVTPLLLPRRGKSIRQRTSVTMLLKSKILDSSILTTKIFLLKKRDYFYRFTE